MSNTETVESTNGKKTKMQFFFAADAPSVDDDGIMSMPKLNPEIFTVDGAAGRNGERGALVRDSGLRGAGSDEPEGDGIVEGADLEHAGSFAFFVDEREFRAVAVIGDNGMDAVPWVSFLDLIRLGAPGFHALGQVNAVGSELHGRGFDDRLILIANREFQSALVERRF